MAMAVDVHVSNEPNKVPKYFTMNYKTYTKRSPEFIEQYKGKHPNQIEFARRFAAEKVPCYFPEFHVLGTPLVEVFCVKVYRDGSNDETLQVSGTIQATNLGGCDSYETSVDLYNRDDHNPESTRSGGFLSLTGPGLNDYPILPSHDTKLKVHLKDISLGEDNDIAREDIDISFKAQDDSEDVKVGLAKGKHGLVSVLYATLRSAVVAEVDVKVLFTGNQEDSSWEQGSRCLYGSIIARYRNQYGYSDINVAKERHVDHLFRVLFEKPPDQSEHVGDGGHIGLRNSMIAVPAYSSLVIELNLMDSITGLKVVQDKIEFRARDNKAVQNIVVGHGCVVEVLVNWRHPDLLLSERLQCSRKGTNKEHSRGHQLCSPSYLKPQVNTPRVMSTRERMEVFSIFIGHKSYKDLNVYGRIVVYDAYGQCHIFKRDKNRPQPLSPSKRTISIAGRHEAFEGCTNIGMYVYLEDINGGLLIKGDFGWGDSSLQKWYNKRMCSVFQGKEGYAAIHYTVFKRAVQAAVRVSITPKDSSVVHPEVFGTVLAKYSCFNYSNSYESKYHQITLYDESPGNGLESHGHRRLPISRPAISVPLDSSFIIDMDLYVALLPGTVFGEGEGEGFDESKGLRSPKATNKNYEHFRVSKEFQFDGVCETYESILGECYDIGLTILWGSKYERMVVKKLDSSGKKKELKSQSSI